jgi:membrane protein
MSRRYPPIYSIIALIVLVTIAATNTNGTVLYISSTNAKTLATLTNNIANYLGFVLASGFAIVISFSDKYAVFCVHVIIVAIYCKMIFSKQAKEVHTTIKQTLNDYENGRCSQSEANSTLYFWTMWFYMATACVIGLTVANIIIPNFWHISMSQLLEIVSNNLLTDGFGDTLNAPSTITMWIMWTQSAGAIAAMIHVWVKLHNIEKQKAKKVKSCQQ